MNMNFYKRICNIASAGQFDMEPKKYGVLMWARDHDSYDKMLNVLNKKRNIIITNHNYYTCSVWCFDPEDYTKFKDFNDKQAKLTEIFFTEIHNGKTADQAQKLQYEYAINNNAEYVYNAIYNN